MKKNNLSEVQNLTALKSNEQQNLKGGTLLTCEEKRRVILGYSFVERTLVVKNDGKLFLSFRM